MLVLGLADKNLAADSLAHHSRYNSSSPSVYTPTTIGAVA